MIKNIVLKCNKCGKSHTLSVGANADIQSLQDALARFTIPKCADKAFAAVTKLSKLIPEKEYLIFSQNHADALAAIDYDLISESLRMFNLPENAAQMQPVAESNFVKHRALANLTGSYSIFCLRICPICKKPHQSLALVLNYNSKKEVFFSKDACLKCGAPLTLVSDENCGFCNEGMKTIFNCDCGNYLTAEKISFTN